MRILSFLPAVAFVVLACGDDPVQGPVVDIVAEGTTFTPNTTTTTATDTLVLWGFADAGHNVTFEDGAPGSANPASAGSIFTRNYKTVAAGTHRFRCTIHSTNFVTGMVGTVVKS